VDGHPENAAASAYGGLVAAAVVDGRPIYRRLALDADLRFVFVIPDRPLATEEARAVLPLRVPYADALFNLGRMGLLVAGLADRTGLVPEAGDDRLHQDARTTLFPEAPDILAGLRAAGALTSCWSGAGPSLLALCDASSADLVARAAGDLLYRHRMAGEVRLLEADLEGVTVSGPHAK
jgi:homoserine kinase